VGTELPTRAAVQGRNRRRSTFGSLQRINEIAKDKSRALIASGSLVAVTGATITAAIAINPSSAAAMASESEDVIIPPAIRAQTTVARSASATGRSGERAPLPTAATAAPAPAVETEDSSTDAVVAASQILTLAEALEPEQTVSDADALAELQQAAAAVTDLLERAASLAGQPVGEETAATPTAPAHASAADATATAPAPSETPTTAVVPEFTAVDDELQADDVENLIPAVLVAGAEADSDAATEEESSAIDAQDESEDADEAAPEAKDDVAAEDTESLDAVADDDTAAGDADIVAETEDARVADAATDADAVAVDDATAADDSGVEVPAADESAQDLASLDTLDPELAAEEMLTDALLEATANLEAMLLDAQTLAPTGVVPAPMTAADVLAFQISEARASAPELAALVGSTAGFANGQLPESVLCHIAGTERSKLRCDAAAQFERLNEAFKAEFGYDISITDSYRSYAEQVSVKASKGYLAATPGTSNHGWGVALDLGSGISEYGSAQYEWMAEHAGAFGWVNPDWAKPGGSKLEPWHWEYSPLAG